MAEKLTEMKTVSSGVQSPTTDSRWSSLYNDTAVDDGNGGDSAPKRNSVLDVIRRSSYLTSNPDGGKGVEEEKLGLIKGVYLPTVQNILGVILFLRLPWIVAQAGVILTVTIVCLCVLSTFLTSLSLSAIATNGKIMAGGPYFVISRNLGVEVGGAIGCIFYLGTTLAASMYILGAIESLQVGFGLVGLFPFDVQVEALILCFCMVFTVHVGVKYVNMSAFFFLFIVFLSIFSSILGSFLYLGGYWEGEVDEGSNIPGDNWDSNFTKDPDTGLTPTFFTLIGLFYPSVTGIMAGCNRSGVLENPSRDIPIGTVGAILTTFAIYITVVVLMGNILSNEYLMDDKLAFASIAWPPVLVNIGIVLSSVGAGLQSLTGAPRLLSAIANDGVIPFLAPFACDGGVNPTKAIWMTYVIASLPCLAGNLDYITPLVTMFFLVMYTTMNISAFLLAFLKAPGFRPTWKYFSWATALVGALLCLAMMFMISWYIAIVVLALVAILFLYIKSKHAERDWGDSTSGFKFSLIRQLLESLSFTAIAHAKNWRPQALVFYEVEEEEGEFSAVDPDLLRFAGHLKKGRGLAMFVGILQGDPIDLAPVVEPARIAMMNSLLALEIRAFNRVIIGKNMHESFCTAFQTMGIGALRPNTVVTSFDCAWREHKEKTVSFVNQLKTAAAFKQAIVLLRQSATTARKLPSLFNDGRKIQGTIDIWWVIHDGGLLLLVPYLMTLHKKWQSCKLRLFAVAQGEFETVKSIEVLTRDFLNNIRIEAEIHVVRLELGSSADCKQVMDEMVKMRKEFDLVDDTKRDSYNGTMDSLRNRFGADSISVLDALKGNPAAPASPPSSPSSKGKSIGTKEDDANMASTLVKERSRANNQHVIDEQRMLWAVSLNKEIHKQSGSSPLVVTNLPITSASSPSDFMCFTSAITAGLETCVLVKGSGDEVITKYG